MANFLILLAFFYVGAWVLWVLWSVVAGTWEDLMLEREREKRQKPGGIRWKWVVVVSGVASLVLWTVVFVLSVWGKH